MAKVRVSLGDMKNFHIFDTAKHPWFSLLLESGLSAITAGNIFSIDANGNGQPVSLTSLGGVLYSGTALNRQVPVFSPDQTTIIASPVYIGLTGIVTGVLDLTATGVLTGGSLVTGGNIGVAADSDLLQLALDSLTINGAVSSSNLSGTNTGDISLGGVYDYLTLVGQVLTRGQIDLAADVTGTLPIGNGGTGETAFGTNRVIYQHATTGKLTSVNTFVFDGTNLGIGTDTPLNLLHIVKSNSGGTSTAARLENPFSVADTGVSFDFRVHASNTITGRITNLMDSLTAERHLVFRTFTAAGSLSEKMRITGDGKIGIGITVPTVKLDVVGDIKASATTEGTTHYFNSTLYSRAAVATLRATGHSINFSLDATYCNLNTAAYRILQSGTANMSQSWWANNSTPSTVQYLSWFCILDDTTAGSEDAHFALGGRVAGTYGYNKILLWPNGDADFVGSINVVNVDASGVYYAGSSNIQVTKSTGLIRGAALAAGGAAAKFLEYVDADTVQWSTPSGSAVNYIWLTAIDGYAPAASAASESIVSITNRKIKTISFADNSTTYYEFQFVWPPGYGGGTLTATIIWTTASGTAGSRDCRWQIELASVGQADSLKAAWGTAVLETGSYGGGSTDYKNETTAVSGAITPSGTPAAGEMGYMRVARIGADADDTLGGAALLIAVKLAA